MKAGHPAAAVPAVPFFPKGMLVSLSQTSLHCPVAETKRFPFKPCLITTSAGQQMLLTASPHDVPASPDLTVFPHECYHGGGQPWGWQVGLCQASVGAVTTEASFPVRVAGGYRPAGEEQGAPPEPDALPMTSDLKSRCLSKPTHNAPHTVKSK